MKKVKLICLLALLFSLMFSSPAYAEEKNEIPEFMQAETVIEYITDTDYIILRGGEATQKKPDLKTEYNSLLDGMYVDESNYILEEYPTPKKGMKVTYASDGCILDITSPNEEDSKPIQTKIVNKEAKIAEPRGDALKLVAKWGSYPNVLYKGLNTYMMGMGRATNFYEDDFGQADHRLKKGDVATKLAYDNCKVGTSVGVKHNNKAVTMYKWDAGRMDNAILDIYKDGVEYFGYKWKPSLSIDPVVYTHG